MSPRARQIMTNAQTRTPMTAGLARRLAAASYDLLVLGGVLMSTSFPIVMARNGTAVPIGNAAFRVFLLAQVAAFFLFFWCRGGQTPGMRAWGLRVEMTDGRALGLPAAMRRLAASMLSGAALGLGFLWILLDSQQRAWHDRLGATRVVRMKNR